ncbi:MAG: hypothetical protein IKI04_00705, partial [Bacilli bacterium]|nr:hypothetical protein [Bacilli bacterium]
MAKEENNENQLNWEKYGRWTASVPENATEDTDVVLYIRPGGSDFPPGYEGVVADEPDKIIVYGTAGDGFTPEEIPGVIHEIEEKNDVSVGVIDVNAHSRTDRYAIQATNNLYDSGYTVGHTTILDGNSTFTFMDSRISGKGLTNADWQKFATTGSELNVFSRGADGLYQLEKDRLGIAINNGVPITYTLCDFDGNSSWEEKHASVPRDLLANNLMGIYDGTSNTFSFDRRLTKADNSYIDANPAHVTGFKWSDTYDYDQNKWVRTYDRDTDGYDYSGLVNRLGSSSSIYHTPISGGGTTLAPLMTNVHDEISRMSTLLGTFSGSFNSSIVDLPQSENLVVCREELEAFKSSPILTNLQSTIAEAGNLQNLIASFRNNGLLKGDVWNLAYDKLDVYDEALSKMAEAAGNLGKAISNAIDQLLACYDRYPDIPADKIQTSNLSELTTELSNLRTSLESIPKEIESYDPVTKKSTMVTNPYYTEMVEKINNLQHLVDAITDFKETYERVKIELDAAMEELKAFGGMVA